MIINQRVMNEILVWLCLALLWPQLIQASGTFNMYPDDSVIIGKLGSSVVLPCWLSPSTDAEVLEIRWYRPDKFNTPLLFYRNQKIVTDPQDGNYIKRSSLASRNMQSAGLKEGDVSLRLENLNKDDEGIFNCYVSGDDAYGSTSVILNVTVPGMSPVLSLKPQDGMVNVSCSSCGWRPKPIVLWKSNRNSLVPPGGLVYFQGGDKLTCVQSWVLLSPSKSQLTSCILSVPEDNEKDSTVEIPPFPEDSSGPWKPLFAVALIAALAMIGVSVFICRKYRPGYIQAKRDEEAELTGCNYIGSLREDAVNFTLNTENISPDLVVSADRSIVRDQKCAAENHRGPGFPYYLSINGNKTFTTGRAYWEVGLKAPNSSVKNSWLIGVTKASHYINNDKSDLTPAKGFWFLCSDRENGLHVNTEPEISLLVNPRPETVGVLLDYDKGELSFYNVKEKLHLFTMKTKFQGLVVPLFNPGIGDECPLKIIKLPDPPEKSTDEPAVVDNTQTNNSNQSQNKV